MQWGRSRGRRCRRLGRRRRGGEGAWREIAGARCWGRECLAGGETGGGSGDVLGGFAGLVAISLEKLSSRIFFLILKDLLRIRKRLRVLVLLTLPEVCFVGIRRRLPASHPHSSRALKVRPRQAIPWRRCYFFPQQQQSIVI